MSARPWCLYEVVSTVEPLPGARDVEDPQTQHLRRVITLRHAVALYTSSVLGAGILVTPGLSARIAGPSSLLAWFLLSVASYPFAYTFASLSARRPESGGIYSFAREAFGSRMATMVAWLFVAWGAFGAPAITLAAGYYLAFAFPLSRPEIFVTAGAVLLVPFVINYRGIRLSARVQLATVALIVFLLMAAVVASLGRIQGSNFSPLFPNGVTQMGVAAALIFWSYLGYENVSNVAGEFKDPKRDFQKSVLISVLLIGALYMAVAFVTIGTGDYRAGSGVTPFALMMDNVFGVYGGAVASLTAVFIIFGAVNAYTAGMARVAYAAASDGSFPRLIGTVDPRSGVPRRAMLALVILNFVSLIAFYLLQLDIQTGFLATSGAAILCYVIGSAAGIKLLKESGYRKILPWISLSVSLVVLPFIGLPLLASFTVGGVGLAYGIVSFRRRSGSS